MLPSGLEFRVLKNGFGGHPTAADFAEFSFNARLISGKIVDSASPDLPANLQVSNLLRGLSEALQRMQVGDRWELVVPADLAFGAKGTAAVPPNQTLVFDITPDGGDPAPAGPVAGSRPLLGLWLQPWHRASGRGDVHDKAVGPALDQQIRLRPLFPDHSRYI